MKEQLIGILGLRKDATDKEIISKVSQLDTDIRGKMGFANLSLMKQMIKLGYFQFSEQFRSWSCRQISEEEMNRILE